MFKRLFILLSCFSLFSFITEAQTPKIEIGGYIDTYIATDNSNGSDTANPNYGRLFSYVCPKKNEFSINTAQITAKIGIPDLIRSNITFHYGDLHKTAWANAGTAMPVIQQANAGVRVYDKLWIDAGYFLTHIGGESLLPKDNWLTTHSLITYYEPFYQAGVRLSYESERVNAQIHLLNGNGIIEDNNQNKSLGLFFSYSPGEILTASYAGIIGNEEPGSPSNSVVHQLHNLVILVNPMKNFSFKAQFDLAMKDVKGATDTSAMIKGSFYGLGLTARWQFLIQFASTCRIDYMDNSDGVYAPAAKGTDLTLGVEYKPSETSYIRLEGRQILLNNYYLFLSDSKYHSGRAELILNMGVWFN